MNNRRSYLLIGTAVFMVGVAMRTIPLYWSPLPFNVDGLKFATLARETLTLHYLPFSWKYLQPDEHLFTALLAITSRVAGVPPLHIAQILIASIGAIPCLFVVAITRRVGDQLQWSCSDIRIAAFLAGLVLATEGIFLGRSTAVSSEGVGHLFAIMCVFVFAHALWTSRPSWILLAGLIFLVFPLTHNLSTVIGGFSAISLLALYFRDSTGRMNFIAGILVVGFCIYTSVYYAISELNELSRISSIPGLFIAWIIILVLLTIWLSTTQPRYQRDVPMMILFGGGGLVLVNYFVPVFPGTATVEPITLLFILPVAAIGGISIWGIPAVIGTRVDGYAIFALLIGTLSLIGFALTAGLTIEYQDLAVRGQIFIHIAFAVLAGLGAVNLARKYNIHGFRTVLVVFIVVCSVTSAPLAFSGLHATSAQPLVTKAEFETGTFASMYVDQWMSDGHMTRVASNYFPRQTNASQVGIYNWLRGSGSVPSCPIVSQRSWTTVGAQLFPSSPKQINRNSYEEFTQSRNLIYATSGNDLIVLTIPRENEKDKCANFAKSSSAL